MEDEEKLQVDDVVQEKALGGCSLPKEVALDEETAMVGEGKVEHPVAVSAVGYVVWQI